MKMDAEIKKISFEHTIIEMHVLELLESSPFSPILGSQTPGLE